MESSLYQTVVVPVGLGSASSFNQTIFPVSLHRKRDSLGQGDLYLDATLDEMLKITNIGADPQQLQEFVDTTKARYDQLMRQKSQLEQRPKSKMPWKRWAKYRSARLFLVASKSLYHATKSRSEEMVRVKGRNLLSIPAADVQPVNGDIPPDSSLVGIAIKLDRPLDDATTQQILDAANTIASYSGILHGDVVSDSTSSFLTDEYVLASESLTSPVESDSEETLNESVPSLLPSPPPMIINNFYSFHGSVYSPHSNVYGATVQIDGTGNSGSVTHTTIP